MPKDALALPGSPFLLQVEPGPPFGPSTQLDMRGFCETGETWVSRIQAKDKVGNSVSVGGGALECTPGAGAEGLETAVRDMSDGTYEFSVMSTKPGVYEVHLRIGGLPLLGSPARLPFRSTIPDMERCVISGAGVSSFKVNEPATIVISLRDRHGNPCVPSAAFCASCHFGMSMMVVTAQQLAAWKGRRPPVSEHEVWGEFGGSWGTHDAKDGGGKFFELKYVRREGGGGISLSLWYSLGSVDSERCALNHEKPFVVGEGVEAKVTQKAQAQKAEGENIEEKESLPGDYTVSKRVVEQCQERWGKVEIDAFASEATAQCRRFFIPGDSTDPYADLGSAEGANALKMIWVRGTGTHTQPAHTTPSIANPGCRSST